MKLAKILALILTLVMVLSLGAFASGDPSGGASGEASGSGEASDASGEVKSVEEAYVDYIREWLQNELLHNDQMTQEQIDNEYMPLIEAGDYSSWPVSYLYDGWLETGTAMTFEEFAAQYQPALSVEDAFIEYIHEWLLAELEVNANMTIEQIEDEFMPLVREMNFVDFPAEMLYSGMLEQGYPMTFEEFAAQYKPAGGEVTWKDYQDWLISILPDICPDPEGVTPLIQALTGWDDIDFSSGPWEKIFGEEYFGCTTWEEFQANGGVGTFNDYEDLPA